LQLAELNLSYTKLTVDVDCVVDSIAVSVNENVSTNTEISRVNCSDELEIEVAVPESVIGDLSNGKVAQIKFDAISGVTFSGKVIEVGVGANGLGSTFPVTILVDINNDSDIRPGLAASVSFENNTESKRDYLLPLSAVVQGSEGSFVYVVNPLSANEMESEGTVSKKVVSLGELQTGGIEVSAGLSAGDRVIVAGVSFVREGLMVAF
jgi:RND family efflux transporter MFP subunit